jgi:hypothetical protein
MSRGRAVALRPVITAFLVFAVFWGLLRTYLEYKAHRAIALLDEASSIQIGDPEAAVLILFERYGGNKWTPDPLSPREQWTDLREYDFQNNLQSDYKYDIGVSPFGITSLHPSRFTQVLRVVKKAVPARLRPILGMRNWGVGVDFAIRNGRVQSISALALFEGRSEWLGHEWRFSNEMPHHELQGKVFVVDSAILEMEDGGGTAIENIFTTGASQQAIQAARKFNTQCFMSMSGCDGLCDVAPRALEYLTQHPDARGNIIPQKCP